MPVPSHEHATALMTEYTYHGQENRLDTYGLEPSGPYEILLKASLQVCALLETFWSDRSSSMQASSPLRAQDWAADQWSCSQQCTEVRCRARCIGCRFSGG